MSVTDVVIIGRRYANSSGIIVTDYSFTKNYSGSPVESYDNSSNTNASFVEVKVNVEISTEANTDKVNEAAKNIADTVALIIAEARKLPFNTVITLPDRKTTTAGQLLSDIQNTKFIITDNPNFGNGGVGGADRPTMTDRLYYAAFAEGTGRGSYTNAQWLGQGLVGTILHELGHISAAGYANLGAENAKWNREMAERKIPHIPADFYSLGQDYAFDHESYANGSALASASALGININTYSSLMISNGKVGSYVGPDGIYARRKSDEGF